MITIFLSPDTVVPFLTFVAFGLAFGSFLNVCIYRLPRGLTLMTSSACPQCQQPIKPYYNVPVLGWMLLGGRCKSCKARISFRYVLVEMMIGILFGLCYLRFGLTAESIKYCVFGFLIIGLIFTDADLHLLPDAMTLPGLGLGLLFGLFYPEGGAGWLERHGWDQLFQWAPFDMRWRGISILAALLGAAFGALAIWSVGEVYRMVRGVEGMGFGDVKLMAMVGAFLGIKLTLLTLMLGSVMGSIAGMVALFTVFAKRRSRRRWSGARAWASAKLVMRHYEMPFGVFLGAMALFSAWFGDQSVAWYMGFYR